MNTTYLCLWQVISPQFSCRAYVVGGAFIRKDMVTRSGSTDWSIDKPYLNITFFFQMEISIELYKKEILKKFMN